MNEFNSHIKEISSFPPPILNMKKTEVQRVCNTRLQVINSRVGI